VHQRGQMARTPWRRLATRPVYENGWIRVREDQVTLPDGKTTIYGVVECGGCVGVLPFLDAETVVLVGQYRYVSGGDPTEFIEVQTFPFDEVLRMVERDEIKDSMTIVAVLHAARRRHR